ncbi:MAG: DUF2062 domain-containing protein [Deltaproteobacteria bacterium]|nr:DUF2062 domain-containing protein [Deltaproteobacteria bacterium]
MQPSATPSRSALWWRALRRTLKRVATTRATPAGLGLAVFVGVIIGTTPFVGVQILITLAVCFVLRLNPVVTYLAANISLPPVIPFLAYGSIQFGHVAFGGRWLSVDEAMALAHDPWRLGVVWVIGSLLFGATLGAPAGLATFFAVRAYRKRHPLPPDPVGDAMQRVIDRFLPVGRFAHGYVQGKLHHDPVYRQLADLAPLPMPFVDVGCGRGHTGLLLSELQADAAGHGVDWDPAKIDAAKRAATGVAQLTYEVADVANWPVPTAKTILLLDVLHYHDAGTQDAILRRAAAALLQGGVLLLRDVDLKQGLRARITKLQEQLGRALGINRGKVLCFREAGALIQVLETAGLEVQVKDSHAGTPLANVLIVARRA